MTLTTSAGDRMFDRSTLLYTRAKSVAMNDNRIRRGTVRRFRGGVSHYADSIDGQIVTMCGQKLTGALVWSSGTEASCLRCTHKAIEGDRR